MLDSGRRSFTHGYDYLLFTLVLSKSFTRVQKTPSDLIIFDTLITSFQQIRTQDYMVTWYWKGYVMDIYISI